MAGPTGAAESDEDRVILRDGSTVVVRPLATGDVAAIAAWSGGLGARDPACALPRQRRKAG